MLYLLRRVLSAGLVIFGALTMVFLILYWLPGDAAALVAGEDASGETINAIRHRLGTDKPFWDQYLGFVEHLAQGDMGTSFATGESVWHRISAQIPATLELTLAGGLVAIVVGILMGVLAAINRDRWLDHTIQTLMLLFTAMPTFWVGILLVLVFSVLLRWLPAVGNGSIEQLILPMMCLGLHAASRLARMVRNSVLDVLDEPFVTTLRGKGLRERQVLYRHVLRNALIPVLTLFGMIVGELISSAVVTETVFARQGLGRLLVEAVGVKDIPTVMGVTLIASMVYVLVNLLVDISYAWVDPRIQS